MNKVSIKKSLNKLWLLYLIYIDNDLLVVSNNDLLVVSNKVLCIWLLFPLKKFHFTNSNLKPAIYTNEIQKLRHFLVENH